MLYGELGVDFFTTSELLYPNIKVKIRLIKARPNLYMISDNPYVSLGTVDCSLYNGRITLKDDYHKKRMDMLAYSPVEYNYLGTLAKNFIVPARQNQFIQKKTFSTRQPSDGMPMQRTHILFSRVSPLKINTGISSLDWGILKYYAAVNLLLTMTRPLIAVSMLQQWQQWTFMTIYLQSQLTFSRITMCSRLIWYQCKTQLKIAAIRN